MKLKRLVESNSIQFNGKNKKELIDFCKYLIIDGYNIYSDIGLIKKIQITDWVVKVFDTYFHMTNSEFEKYKIK